MSIIRIVAAVVDTRQLTLYKEDGKTVTIPQGDHRLRLILAEATPQMHANRQPDGSTWADVNIEAVADNAYQDFEEQSSGVRFFRVAKAALNKLLGKDKPPATPVPPQYVGQVPATPSPAAPAAPATPVSVAPAQASELTEEEQELSNWITQHVLSKPSVQEVPEADEVAEGTAAQPPVLTDVITPSPAVQAMADQLQAEATDDQAETFEPVEQVPETKVEQTMSVVDEIIAHAVPVSSEKFNEKGLVQQRPMVVNAVTSNDHPDDTAEDTIIAVVGDKIIPGMELIKSQFGRAAKMGSVQGVENFLKRLSTVIESRSHSVEDLLKFMERADLPIADDGTIIIYKVLNKQGDRYVDCHTGRVQQWVGAYVCMDPSLVDHNRSNECSNGLHVARRGLSLIHI